MINRELEPITVLTYEETIDSYGQRKTGTPTTRVVDMVIKIYSQNYSNDIRYNDVELIGLTADNDITDKNEIVVDNEIYYILYVIPGRRLNQILMKKK